MSFQKPKCDSYCVGGRHRSVSKNIYGDLTYKDVNVLIGYCSICKRKKYMTVSDNTIQAESLGDFFKSLDEKGPNVLKMMTKNFFEKSFTSFGFYSKHCYSSL